MHVFYKTLNAFIILLRGHHISYHYKSPFFEKLQSKRPIIRSFHVFCIVDERVKAEVSAQFCKVPGTREIRSVVEFSLLQRSRRGGCEHFHGFQHF